MWLSGVFCSFIFFWTTIYARKDETSVLLSRLLSPTSLAQETPVIIIVDPKNQLNLLENDKILDSAVDSSGDVRDDDETPEEDQDAYLLYNALRSQPQDHLKPSEIKQLEKTKQVLRSALRARCNKLKKCVKKCPKKKRRNCESNCQEIIDKKNACDDDEDVTTTPEPECEEEEKCEKKKEKWGKTMPPKWLLRLQSK